MSYSICKSVDVDFDVCIDEFDIKDIIEYVEESGYRVVKSAACASESASGMCESSYSSSYSYYGDAQLAIKNIAKVCDKYDAVCNTFYRDLVAAIVFMPAMTDVDVLLGKLKEKMQ